MFWNVTATNVTGVRFEIRTTTSTVNSSATSTGGSVSGLTPGTKYNFFVVSIPPSDANFNYSEVNATMQVVWTSKFSSMIFFIAFFLLNNEMSTNLSQYFLNAEVKIFKTWFLF